VNFLLSPRSFYLKYKRKKSEGRQNLRSNQLWSLATDSGLHFSFFQFQILNDILAACTLYIKCGNLLSTIVQTSVPTEASIHLRYLNRNIRHCHLPSLSITTSTVHDAMKNVYSIYHIMWRCYSISTRAGTLIVATIYLQLIQNRYMFRRFTVLQCSHHHCVQLVASDVEVVGYL